MKSLFDIDNWQEIFAAIKKNKIRSLLTAFGVFWGILMLIVMAGSGKGLENGTMEGYKNFAKNSAFIWAQSTSIPYAGFDRGREWEITNEDLKNISSQMSEVKLLSPRLEPGYLNNINNVIYEDKKGSFTIVGDHHNYNKIEPMKLLEGRFLNKSDIDEKRNVCVIGQRVKETFFNDEEIPIGKMLKISGIYFKIIGVLKPGVDDSDGAKKKTIHIPISTIQAMFNYGDRVDYFGVVAKKNIKISEIENKLIRILKMNHKISPKDEQAIGHINLEKMFTKIQKLFQGVNLLTWIVGMGTLFAGVLVITNIMLLVVKERTKEIGIKRALGATPVQIQSQIICESVFLTTFSGYAGLVLGGVVLQIMNFIIKEINAGGTGEVFFKNPEISLQIALSSLAVLVIAGAVAGILPSRNAIKIKPIDAIRDE
ncbi:MAG: ABC transporter permease [Rhodothermaceae bacterium]